MPKIGDIYSLAENDYRYGTGPLVARVVEVVKEVLFQNEPWWDVEAVVKPPDTNGPGRERRLYVRAASLR